MLMGTLSFYDNRVSREAEAERARKAAPPPRLAAGAKSDEESRILTSLRASPAISEAAISRDTGLNATAVMLAVRALQDRGLVRWNVNVFGGSTLIATS